MPWDSKKSTKNNIDMKIFLIFFSFLKEVQRINKIFIQYIVQIMRNALKRGNANYYIFSFYSLSKWVFWSMFLVLMKKISFANICYFLCLTNFLKYEILIFLTFVGKLLNSSPIFCFRNFKVNIFKEEEINENFNPLLRKKLMKFKDWKR